jgi:uncharacterized surface protein with fasciclin (FAS1) repeats
VEFVMMRKLFAAVAVLSFAGITARADEAKTIAEIVAGSKDHTILLTAVKAAGLAEKLGEKGAWTVFAPTDAAFKKLGDETIKKVVADKELLTKILKAHAVEGTWEAEKVLKLDGKSVKTLEGTEFKVEVKEKSVYFGGAKVIKADLKASNGVVHVIDTVLMPK